MLLLAFTVISVMLIFDGLVVPLTNNLTRLRANYNPKGIQLDGSDSGQISAKPGATSYFSLLVRVKRIEGWSGLFRGFMPTMIFGHMLSALIAAAFYFGLLHSPNIAKLPLPAFHNMLLVLMSIFNLFLDISLLPVLIIAYRGLTTPYRLPWFSPTYSLHALLTTSECHHPWTLYQTPGLLLAAVLQSISLILIKLCAHQWVSLLKPTADGRSFEFHLGMVNVSLFLVVICLYTITLCPLDVIVTKLAIQRNHAGAAQGVCVEQDMVVDVDVTPVNHVIYSNGNEDVIRLRHEQDPYRGIIDCAKKVVQEEGWGALYRGWQFTLLAGIIRTSG